MKLRTAIKICRDEFEAVNRQAFTARGYRMRRLTGCRRRYQTQLEAVQLCRKKWRHPNVPYIPSDEEMRDSAEVIGGIFNAIAGNDPDHWIFNCDMGDENP
jgi:hypothetical protein